MNHLLAIQVIILAIIVIVISFLFAWVGKKFQEYKNQSKGKFIKMEYNSIATKIIIIYRHKEYLLKSLKNLGEPAKLIDYLYRNPRRTISLQELKEKAGFMSSRTIPNIIIDIGFKGELGKIFFKCSKNEIVCRKSITNKEAEKLRVDKKKLEKELSSLTPLSR